MVGGGGQSDSISFIPSFGKINKVDYNMFPLIQQKTIISEYQPVFVTAPIPKQLR